ncbi:hypothetical protein [Desulfurobacterium sp.]
MLDRIVDYVLDEYEFLLSKDADMPCKDDYARSFYFKVFPEEAEKEYKKALRRHYFWKYYYRLTHLPLYLPYLLLLFCVHVKVFFEYDILKKPIEF